LWTIVRIRGTLVERTRREDWRRVINCWLFKIVNFIDLSPPSKPKCSTLYMLHHSQEAIMTKDGRFCKKLPYLGPYCSHDFFYRNLGSSSLYFRPCLCKCRTSFYLYYHKAYFVTRQIRPFIKNYIFAPSSSSLVFYKRNGISCGFWTFYL
jgi:hypothetical protein